MRCSDAVYEPFVYRVLPVSMLSIGLACPTSAFGRALTSRTAMVVTNFRIGGCGLVEVRLVPPVVTSPRGERVTRLFTT
jgi:hypothetical protein